MNDLVNLTKDYVSSSQDLIDSLLRENEALEKQAALDAVRIQALEGESLQKVASSRIEKAVEDILKAKFILPKDKAFWKTAFASPEGQMDFIEKLAASAMQSAGSLGKIVEEDSAEASSESENFLNNMLRKY